MHLITILYVEDQELSCNFYRKLLGKEPVLNVEGMTEFDISPGVKLGLMPNDGIARILKDKTPHPKTGTGIPRCELYFYVDDVGAEYINAVRAGATLVSHTELRNWGDKVCYFSDPDGHIIAFAEKVAR